MSVDPEISAKVIEEELEGISILADTFDWEIDFDRKNLVLLIKMRSSRDNEQYIIEAKCDDYKAIPPLFEFIHPDRGNRGGKDCYPADGGGFFHSTPCICVQWNRKAYKTLGGPHSNWNMANWQSYRLGTTTLGDMFLKIQLLINGDKYTGRME